MDVEFEQINNLVTVLREHRENGGRVETGLIVKELRRAVDFAAIDLLKEGKTVGEVVEFTGMSPGRVKTLAESI